VTLGRSKPSRGDWTWMGHISSCCVLIILIY